MAVQMALALLAVLAAGHTPAGTIYFPNRQRPWDKIPTVTISAQEKDPRIGLALEAVDFWNSLLSEIGTTFRLGPVIRTTEIVPAYYVAKLSEAVLNRMPLPEMPDNVKMMQGDLIVAMSDGDFISFSPAFRPGGRVVVGIRSHHLYPLTLPNVARNVIAHELGHAIGLGHNDDPKTLMCGRPSPCRPDAFRSSTDKFFPLTEEEKASLLKIYPPTWRPTR